MSTNTRNRSGTMQIDEIKELLLQLESSLSRKIDDVLKKVESLEISLESIKANQIRLDKEVDSMKLVIIAQQKHIEKIEAEKREKNVIFQGVPESNVEVDGIELKDDKAKAKCLTSLITENVDSDCIDSVHRLGKGILGRNRNLLVKYHKKDTRDSVLFGQKKLRTTPECKESFGTIFINRDSTELIRKEEKRLRDVMRKMRPSINADDRIYIKHNKLFLNDEVIDSVDISKQLF